MTKKPPPNTVVYWKKLLKQISDFYSKYLSKIIPPLVQLLTVIKIVHDLF